MKDKLESAWALPSEVALYSQLKTEFNQSSDKMAVHWTNCYCKRLGFNFRIEQYKFTDQDQNCDSGIQQQFE